MKRCRKVAHEHRAWAPLSPAEVSDLLRDLSVPWWVAGGWAIDLIVGKQTRPHADIDVQFLRADQRAVQATLSSRSTDRRQAGRQSGG